MNQLDKLTILREINTKAYAGSEGDFQTCLVGRCARDSRFVAEGAWLYHNLPIMTPKNKTPDAVTVKGRGGEIVVLANASDAIRTAFAEFFGVSYDDARVLCSGHGFDIKANFIDKAIAKAEREKAKRETAEVAKLAALTEPPAVDAAAPQETAHERATMSRAVGRAGRAVGRILARG